MNDFLLFLAAAGFGALAWAMLALSDWLFREGEPHPASRRKSNSKVQIGTDDCVRDEKSRVAASAGWAGEVGSFCSASAMPIHF